MSPRAACRLETLGFERVYDYVGGKADWVAAGLPVEGRLASEPRAGDLARRDPPTCRLTDSGGEVGARLEASDWDVCVVVDEAGCVLGRVLPGDLGEPSAPVETVMQPGPWTQRPHVLGRSLAERMRGRSVEHVLITSTAGVLLGVLYGEDVERLEARSRKAVWEECEGCPGVWRP